jgi:drug/metabolite transporter (DMT)-like permease
MKRTLTGTLLVLFASASYATLPILVKFAYQADMSALSVLLWRFVFGALLAWLAWPLWRRSSPLRDLSLKQALTLIGMGAYFCLSAFAAVMALARVPATTFTLLLYTYPAMVALLSLLLGERLPPTSWLAVALATGGSALTALGGAEGELVIRSLGDVFWPLANALAYAIYLILIGRLGKRATQVSSTVLTITGTLLAACVVGLVGGTSAPATSQGWLSMLGLGALGTVVPLVGMFGGVARIGPTNASILATVEPLVTILLAAALLHERATVTQLWGGALILTSVVLLNVGPIIQARAASRQPARLPD